MQKMECCKILHLSLPQVSLLLLMFTTLSSCCFIRNCPPGGKRSMGIVSQPTKEVSFIAFYSFHPFNSLINWHTTLPFNQINIRSVLEQPLQNALQGIYQMFKCPFTLPKTTREEDQFFSLKSAGMNKTNLILFNFSCNISNIITIKMSGVCFNFSTSNIGI